MQPDPIGFAAGDPNLYRYVSNNPINAVDPLGLAEGPLGKTVEALGGVAVLGPGGAWGAQGTIAQEARTFSKAASQSAEANGYPINTSEYQNAARHAYWQMELTLQHGSLNADLVGMFHEAGSTQATDSWVDLYNNRVAQRLTEEAGSRQEALEKIREALRNGGLITDFNDPRIPCHLRGGKRSPGQSGSAGDSTGSGW